MKAKLTVREYESMEDRRESIRDDQYWVDSEIDLEGDSIKDLKRQSTAILREYFPAKAFRRWKQISFFRFERVSNEHPDWWENWKEAYIYVVLLIDCENA